jgi:hypothetical protein
MSMSMKLLLLYGVVLLVKNNNKEMMMKILRKSNNQLRKSNNQYNHLMKSKNKVMIKMMIWKTMTNTMIRKPQKMRTWTMTIIRQHPTSTWVMMVVIHPPLIWNMFLTMIEMTMDRIMFPSPPLLRNHPSACLRCLPCLQHQDSPNRLHWLLAMLPSPHHTFQVGHIDYWQCFPVHVFEYLEARIFSCCHPLEGKWGKYWVILMHD